MGDPRYNRANPVRDDAENQAALTERAPLCVAQAVSESSPSAQNECSDRTLEASTRTEEASNRAAYLAAHNAKRSERRRWRKENGPFVAQETGTLFKREVGVYDPKAREKPPRVELPLDESFITRERASLREDLNRAEGHPARKTTLEGIYLWLSAYNALPEQEKAKLEEQAGRYRERASQEGQ